MLLREKERNIQMKLIIFSFSYIFLALPIPFDTEPEKVHNNTELPPPRVEEFQSTLSRKNEWE